MLCYYDYNNNNGVFDYYETGFDKETLDDANGSFYIVHPDELCFERNLMGKIIKKVEGVLECSNVKIENYKIVSPKMACVRIVGAQQRLERDA